MHVLLIVNPVSGDIDKKHFIEQAKDVCQFYNIQLRIYKTTGKGDQEEITKLLEKNNIERIAVAGGDGTVNMSISAIRERDIPFGIVPMGSSNGMHKELLGQERPLDAFKNVLVSQQIDELDVLKVNKHNCFHLGDLGINAHLVKAYEKDESRGMITYAKHFLTSLMNTESFAYKLQTDEKSYEGEARMIAICNARKFGAGMPLNQRSNPFDGRFELVIFSELNAKVLLNAGLSFLNESFAKQEGVHLVNAKEALLEFHSEKTLQLDGEVVGDYNEVKISLSKQKPRLITNRDNPYL